jgi:hypothetical protein
MDGDGRCPTLVESSPVRGCPVPVNEQFLQAIEHYLSTPEDGMLVFLITMGPSILHAGS